MEKLPVPLHNPEIFRTCGFVMQDMPLEQMQCPQAHREISRRLESTARIFPFRQEKVRICMGCELEVLSAIGELDV